MTNKAYKARLYPTVEQADLINKTIGHCRFLYNQMLEERIGVYDRLKDDRSALYAYKYKTEAEYKLEFPFLAEAPSRALQQSTRDLTQAYKNFFRRVKAGNKSPGFPQYVKPFVNMLWGNSEDLNEKNGEKYLLEKDLRKIFDYIITLDEPLLRDIKL